MEHGTYVGAETALIGKTALLRDDPESKSRMVLAQFDDVELVHKGNRLGYGWHSFYSYDFKHDPKVNFDEG